MAITKYVRRDAKTLKRALTEAEAKRSVNKRPGDGIVTLKPAQIRMRPELFQPRHFVYGHGTIDTEWVKALAKKISAIGELDADSDGSRPLIPTQSGHRFRRKSATHSDRSRPPVETGLTLSKSAIESRTRTPFAAMQGEVRCPPRERRCGRFERS